MEANAGMVAGSHKRNELVIIRHEGETGLKSLKNLNGQVCQICGDTVGVTATRDVFVACNECAFPVCRPCYEYERKDGSQSCPQCKTRYKRNKGVPRVDGDEEEDDVDLDNEFNYMQGNGKVAHKWQMQQGKGGDNDLPSSRHESQNVIPHLNSRVRVSGETPDATPDNQSIRSQSGPLGSGERRSHSHSYVDPSTPGYEDERSFLMSQKSLEKRFGQSPIFIASPFMEQGGIPPSTDTGLLLREAIHVISCGYEDLSEWGKEIGWIYGSVAEDILTGFKMHARGWISIYCMSPRPAFKGMPQHEFCCTRNPKTSSRSCSPLLLLFDLLLLCSGFAGVGGFEPLIQLPRSRRHGFGSGVAISVDDFGAKGDGCTDDTKAFMDAWEAACSSPSRAVLKIPAGNVYLVRPIDFSGHCKSKLTLLVLGTVVAPSDPAIWEGLDPHKWLYFHGVNHLEVRGAGTINGMGQQWWERSCKINASNPCRHAPTAITFHRSKHIVIKELTLVNSQQMHMAFTHCFRVRASHLKVIAPAKSPNTDGIHISASVSVVVKDCLIKTGDDCISIVSNSSDVLIKNIACGPGHGISIGSLGKSNSWDQVHNVRVDGAFITDTENGVRIKTWQGGRGYARNIVFKNVVMRGVSNPIIIDQYYCDSFKPCRNQTSAVKVAGVSFIGIRGTSATEEVMKFACSDTFPCENIFLKDIQLSLDSGDGGRNATAYCWKASGFYSGLVDPPSCLSSDAAADDLINKQNVTYLHYTAQSK